MRKNRESSIIPTNENKETSTKLKIIICDDQKIILDSFEKVLLSINNVADKYDIIKITDGAFILNQIVNDEIEKKIKIVFTDENMEYINGSEAVQLIKKLEKNGKLSTGIIYCSITAFVGDVSKELLSIGFDRVLSKPINKTQAVSVLKEFKMI